MIKSSWAVLLCKFSDDSTEPFTRDYYEDLFTASGVGSQNMVDYFRDVSHGNLDLSDTHVFPPEDAADGWYTLNMKRSEYLKELRDRPDLTDQQRTDLIAQYRKDLIQLARKAAAAKEDDLSQYVGVVVFLAVALARCPITTQRILVS